jgi:hypothetical protein
MSKRRMTLLFSLCELVIAYLGQCAVKNIHESSDRDSQTRHRFVQSPALRFTATDTIELAEYCENKSRA